MIERRDVGKDRKREKERIGKRYKIVGVNERRKGKRKI